MISRKEFLEQFEDHLKIPFSWRGRKRHRRCFEGVKGKKAIELVRERIVDNIIHSSCPFSFFTIRRQRTTDEWQNQIQYYLRHKTMSLKFEMCFIVRKYKPVWRKKK